jgi:hypothetical protein
MWIKVAEKIVGQVFLFGKNFERWCRITRDAEYLSGVVNKIRAPIPNCAQLAGADTRKSKWVEHDDYVFLATVIG